MSANVKDFQRFVLCTPIIFDVLPSGTYIVEHVCSTMYTFEIFHVTSIWKFIQFFEFTRIVGAFMRALAIRECSPPTLTKPRPWRSLASPPVPQILSLLERFTGVGLHDIYIVPLWGSRTLRYVQLG